MGLIIINLVEKLRDIKPGRNTVLFLDELIQMGLNVLVFDDNVYVDFSHWYKSDEDSKEEIGSRQVRVDGIENPLDFNTASYRGMASTFLDTGTLGKNRPRQYYEDRIEGASILDSIIREGLKNTSYRDPKYEQIMKGLKVAENIHNQERWFGTIKNTGIAERIMGADLVLVPERFYDKVRTELPLAKVAVLEKPSSNKFSLHKASDKRNAPRIIIRGEDEKERCMQPIIDEETIRLLYFDEKHSRSTRLFMDMERDFMPTEVNTQRSGTANFTLDEIDRERRKELQSLYSVHGQLSRYFYITLEKNRKNYLNPHPDCLIGLKVTSEIIRSIFPKEDSKYEVKIRDSLLMILSGLRGYSDYDWNTQNLRMEKLRSIVHYFDGLFIRPLGSLNEAKDRRKLTIELVERQAYFQDIRSLESSLNSLLEPYLHLHSMTAHLCYNALESRFKVPLNNVFYNSYMDLAKEIQGDLEHILSIVSRVKTGSREMKMLLEPIKIMFEEDQPLSKTLGFLQRLSASAPKNIEDLIGFFKTELDEQGIKKDEEMEDYSSQADIEYNAEKQRMLRQEDYSFSFEKSKTESLHFPQLESLIEDFLSRNTIGISKRWINYLNSVGSKLSAFTANAEFIKKKNWCKPKMVSGKKPVLEIVNGFYPLTPTDGKIVRNDTILGGDIRIEINDGANAAGKSIYTRKTAFIATVCASGNYAPADSVTMSWLDYIRYRIKNTGLGWHGAMIQEIAQLAPCVNVFNGLVFLGLDELFTSTNYDEGEALNYALIRLAHDSPGVLLQLTSHFGTLHDLLKDERIKHVKFTHFEYQVDKHGNVIFDYKKRDGPNTQPDYALVIAGHEKLNLKIIQHARVLLEQKENKARDFDDI